MMLDLRVTSVDAERFGRYPTRLASARMRSATSTLTFARVVGLSTRDTVDRCTPVALARSLKVGLLLVIELSYR